MSNFEHITLFTTALCNLNCGYCYICKDINGGLLEIDKDLEQDFLDNKYIKQCLDYDPELKNNLTGITLWGGEPFLKIERFTDHLEEYFKAFPNLKLIDTSTNFTVVDEIEKIQTLLDGIDKYYNGHEQFQVNIQISIDGYEEMNDFGRGKGVTQKFLDNFKKACKLHYNSQKINLLFHTKPTLSKSTFHFLDDEEKCYKWFKFMNDELWIPYMESNAKWQLGLSIFNCAQPTEWEKQDGIEYAKILRNIKNIKTKVTHELPGWNHGNTILPDAAIGERMFECPGCNNLSYEKQCSQYQRPRCGGGCGSFTGNLVPIPHNLFTMCHRGLFDAYTDYCNNLQARDSLNGLSSRYFLAHNVKDWLYTKEEFKVAEKMMKPLNENQSTILYTDLIIGIREFAKAGLINEKYSNIQEIEKTLPVFLENSYCLQDAYIMNGSWVTRSLLEVPLWYNGAMDVVVEELKEIKKSKERI